MLAHEFFPASARPTRVLDFDIENRPLTYWQPDRPTADITSIASMWIEGGVVKHDTIEVLLLGELTTDEILTRFAQRYAEADFVTGHYIRRHDLPIVNGHLYEALAPLLNSVMSIDTKNDMFTKADVPATQEYLLELLGTECPLGIPLEKFHMTQGMWREANRLTEAGLDLTRKRVSTDVHAHAHLMQDMQARGWLGAPRLWSPGGGEVVEGRINTGESK